MKINWLILLAASIIPLVIGFVWYHPKVLGNAWKKASNLSDEQMSGANMALIFGLTFLLSFFVAVAINFMVIHQFHLYSMLASEPGIKESGTEVNTLYTTILEKYGMNFRTFKHGAFHGAIGGITLAFPILAINALFERKGFTYIAINAGYWIICMALMGGVICAFS